MTRSKLKGTCLLAEFSPGPLWQRLFSSLVLQTLPGRLSWWRQQAQIFSLAWPLLLLGSLVTLSVCLLWLG